ncbi:glycosyltransferase [Roseomonas sp. KE2513]|uniref:glycosyltransferase n=1 Tax=Roseomonas sp. KE2513 TaxID=2479202 RepID=UPI0018DFABB0|nr:glycosyltransferase [Roseomonas sp. KE2513]MBI0537863.1 glycosyltransferase [Roseomonas sp. KE2513]
MSRVLHVLKYYRPAFTGEGVFLERSSAVMQEVAPDVGHDLLVTHTPRPEDPHQAAACSTLDRVVHLVRGEPGTIRREAALVWWFLRNLRRYDTVHFRTHADWYFLSYAIARLAGRRLVLSATLDDSLPVLTGQYRPSLRALAARGFRLFDAYVSISPKLMNETLSSGADPARCFLVPCGVTVPEQPPGIGVRLRESLGLSPDDLVLLFVGGLCRRKDPIFLIENLPAVLASAPQARLVLLGPPLEPDYVEMLHERVRALGLDGRVIFAGEQTNPHPYFAAADILVFASQMEGFGTVVPEAMAHGRAVVVRRLPGVNDDFVLEGETGSLFDTAEEYVAAVRPLAADPALRGRIGAAGRALVRRRFGMRTVARRYLDIYGVGDAATPEGRARTIPARAIDPEVPEKETGLGATGSVLDTRFHLPIPSPLGDQPRLVTMVDAEEAFDWSRPFSRDSSDVSSMGEQYRAHRVFERHGVSPLYLADYPVASQDAGRGPLREFLRDGACEVGAQMHPWVTPPFEELVCDHNSYAGNLPPALELEKARRLTDILAEAFGDRPLIYRTGRFGVGPRTADVLRHLGYLADTSVTPGWQPDRRGRWGYWDVSPRPYWCDRDRTLMEIPVTGALVGRLARRHGAQLGPLAFSRAAGRLGVTGALAHLGLLERIRLTPEGMTLEEGKRLVRALLADGHRTFVLTYHSPSLAPGNTPYVRSTADRDRFLDWLDGFYTFFREEVGGHPVSWREVRGIQPARTVTATAHRATGAQSGAEPVLEPPSPA